MAIFNFTKSKIDKLPHPNKRTIYTDADTKTLKLRHSPSGSKTFSFRKKHQGKVIEIKIGPYPAITIEQARLKAGNYASALANGIDPREKKIEHTSVGDLWKMYLKDHLNINATGKSISDADGNYKLYIKPKFANEDITKLTPGNVRKFFTELYNNKGYAPHNKVLNLFKAMINKAVEWELLEKSPVNVKKAPDVERERYLMPDETVRFFEALAEEKREWFRDYVTLSLLTGALQRNILSMRWKDTQLDEAIWHIPRTKNGDSLNVPLVPEAVELLNERKRSGEYVFQSPTSKYGYYIGVDRPWKELLKRAGIDDLRLHDLRRSLGSWQANLGTSLNIIGKSLGHRNVSTTAIYARLQTDPVRQSMEKAVSAMFASGKKKETDEETDNVVNIHG